MLDLSPVIQPLPRDSLVENSVFFPCYPSNTRAVTELGSPVSSCPDVKRAVLSSSRTLKAMTMQNWIILIRSSENFSLAFLCLSTVFLGVPLLLLNSLYYASLNMSLFFGLVTR